MASVGNVKTFAAAPGGSKAPDSITTANGTFFVEYGNGADSTGAGGSSTIVQYDKAGNIEHTYTIPGSVDGLKFNPYTGQIWALQNQDGNSTLTLIDPVSHKVTGPLSFANPSGTNGYDDVVFKGDKVFLSYTNPNGIGDPTLVELVNGNRPNGVLLTTTILADGATGFNTVKGKIELVPQTDPDSLKLAPNGDLLLTSGGDGTIIDVQNAGTANQAVSFTTIQGIPAASIGNAGLDDVIKPGATAGTFYLTDTKINKVYSFHATGLNTNDYYASVGSLKAIDGTVQQLAIHSVGGVVTPAQTLLTIVPADSTIEIEAMVDNPDIGFVHPGQDAKIKVDTFNFTRYGLLHGKVVTLSQDAIPRDGGGKSDPLNASATDVSASEPAYAARVSLDQTRMQVDDKLLNLSPGMAVTVEIRTGTRRIIDYLLSPILRHSQESLRER